MIVQLTGRLVESTPLTCVVDCHGVGYLVHIPVTTAERLPNVGQEVRLLTQSIYREDDQLLFGFATRDERDLFRLLIDKVGGIGPKIALNILSHLSPTSFRAAVVAGDARLLSQCPGIGKKTAERILLELKDKFGPSLAPADAPLPRPGSALPVVAADSADQRAADALSALVALGYKAPEADKALRKVLPTLPADATVEQILKAALKG